MTPFKDLLQSNKFNSDLEFPSASIQFKEHILSARFDSQDKVLKARYSGPLNAWVSSLCYLMEGKTLCEVSHLKWADWEEAFGKEQIFWDLKKEKEDSFLNDPLEMLKALTDIYKGREYLYSETSPLVCRCFGVRESDIIHYLQKNDVVTLEGLSGETKAGMGCRTCVPQLKRFVLEETKKAVHYYKDRSVADWLVQIDYQLNRFPPASEWKMELTGMKGTQVSISFDKETTQKEEEVMGLEIQRFLGGAVDTGLAFFLRRASHS